MYTLLSYTFDTYTNTHIFLIQNKTIFKFFLIKNSNFEINKFLESTKKRSLNSKSKTAKQ